MVLVKIRCAWPSTFVYRNKNINYVSRKLNWKWNRLRSRRTSNDKGDRTNNNFLFFSGCQTSNRFFACNLNRKQMKSWRKKNCLSDQHFTKTRKVNWNDMQIILSKSRIKLVRNCTQKTVASDCIKFQLCHKVIKVTNSSSHETEHPLLKRKIQFITQLV